MPAKILMPIGGIPVCVYEPNMGMFRIVLSKGKSFSSGGFGVVDDNHDSREHKCATAHSATVAAEDDTNDNCDDVREEAQVVDNGSVKAVVRSELTAPHLEAETVPRHAVGKRAEFLFPEEALFLSERGLLQVLPVNDKSSSQQAMFEILLRTDVSLQAYVTYAHLRSQSFIVVRHTERRLHLLRQIQKLSRFTTTRTDTEKNGGQSLGTGDITDDDYWHLDTNDSDHVTDISGSHYDESSNDSAQTYDNVATTICKKRRRSSAMNVLLQELRREAWNASLPPPPTDDDWRIAYDVYQPNSSYRKTNPGPPDYCVAICSFADPSPPFGTILTLVKDIPLVIATVANGGAVILFRIGGFKVPSII